MTKPDPDSPVYTFLSDLQPPILKALERAIAVEESAPNPGDQTLSSLTEMAGTAMAAGEFETAKALYSAARAIRRDDHLVHRLALATYKSGVPDPVSALRAARDIVRDLNPGVSNDPETLGLWGAVHKRLWQATSERASLDTAIRAYERGFDIRTDHYNGINLAFLLNERAKVSDPAEQIADFVNAERVRRRVMPLCHAILEDPASGDGQRYWAAATLAEAHLGIGDVVGGEEWLAKANAIPATDWMRKSTTDQLAQLKDLLEPSPLAMIRPPGQ